MLNYTPSQLTENKTLLEEFLRIRDYLEANPLYKVYYAGTNYVAGVLTYAMTTITLKEGEKLGVGDVVLFSNAYYAKVEDVSEDVTTFTVSQGVNIRGPQGATGATGPQGATGAQGPQGEAGADGKNTWAISYDKLVVPGDQNIYPLPTNAKVGDYVVIVFKYTAGGLTGIAPGYIKSVGSTVSDNIVYVSSVVLTNGAQGPQGEAGNAMYIYDGLLDSSVVDVQVSQITIPTGRTLQAEDILISSYEGSVGALAQVIAIADGVATVDFIGQISAGGSGSISDVKVAGTSVVTDGVANIPKAEYYQNGIVTTGEQTFSGKKIFYPDGVNKGAITLYTDTSNRAVIGRSSTWGAVLGSSDYPFTWVYGSYIWAKTYLKAPALRNENATLTTQDIKIPLLGGTMMVAPSTWSSGTSGSVTLTEAGTYQIYMNDGKNNINFGLVYFDASTDTYAQAPMTSHNEGYLLSIEGSAGDHPSTLHIYQIDNVGHTQTEVNDTVYYRRVGI